MISNKIITRLSNQILPVQPPNYNEYLRGKISKPTTQNKCHIYSA